MTTPVLNATLDDLREFHGPTLCALGGHTDKIITLELAMTTAELSWPQVQRLLSARMPKLASLKLSILRGGPPSEPRFAYSVEQFPSLTELSLDGFSLECALGAGASASPVSPSLARLRSLTLRNYPGTRASVTFHQFLRILETGASLIDLQLSHYLGIAEGDQQERLSINLPNLKKLFVQDTPSQTARILLSLYQLPRNTHIVNELGNVSFQGLNPFLHMLPPHHAAVLLRQVDSAKLHFSTRSLRLVGAGSAAQVQLTLEVASALLPRADEIERGKMLSIAIWDVGYVFALTGVAALECAGASNGVEHANWREMFKRLPGLRELTLVDHGAGHTARRVFEVVASENGTRRGSPDSDASVQDRQVVCPALCKVALHETTYSRALLQAIVKAVQVRCERGGRLESLSLLLRPFRAKTREDSDDSSTEREQRASTAPDSWQRKLSEFVDVVTVRDLPLVE